jgi:hypothetical protein
MDYRNQIISLAETLAATRRISVARISTLCANDGKFIEKLRSGSCCSVDRYLLVKQWFFDNWPADLDWPNGVHLPDILPDFKAPSSDEAA